MTIYYIIISSPPPTGHGGPGTLQDHHDGVLQGRHGVHSHVRHHQRGVVQQCAGLVSFFIYFFPIYIIYDRVGTVCPAG